MLSMGGNHVLKIQQKHSQPRAALDGCWKADSMATGVQTTRGPGIETGFPGQGRHEPEAIPSENEVTPRPHVHGPI